MSCILRISGIDLDVDSLSAALPWSPVQIYRKGEPRFPMSDLSDVKHAFSGLGYVVSNAEMNEFDRQVKDAIQFLSAGAPALAILSTFPGVDQACLDFGITLRDVAIHCDFLPAELLRLAGSLNLGVALSHYPGSLE